MVRSFNYYKLWCSTENKWVYNWLLSTNPQICPNNKDHTLDTTLTTVLTTEVDARQNGFLLRKNTTDVELGASGVYEGTYENVLDYAQISFIVHSDIAGTLYVDMSIDANTPDRTLVYDILADQPEYHSFNVIAEYIKFKFINGPTPQTHFQISPMGHITKTNTLTARTNDSISNNNDVQLIRVVNDTSLDLSKGIHRNQKIQRIHSINENVSTALQDIWDVGGYYPWLNGVTSPSYVQITTSNIQDGITGLGARKIRLYGLDSNYDEITEDINLVGNATTYSINQFTRIHESHVIETGTYHGSNFNNITVGVSGNGSIILSRIGGDGGTINTSDYGVGTSQQSTYTIPNNKTGYISRIQVVVESNKTANLFLYKVENIDQLPNKPRELLWRIDGFTGHYSLELKSYIRIPEKTDIWFRADASATGIISVDYDLYLIDN